MSNTVGGIYNPLSVSTPAAGIIKNNSPYSPDKISPDNLMAENDILAENDVLVVEESQPEDRPADAEQSASQNDVDAQEAATTLDESSSTLEQLNTSQEDIIQWLMGFLADQHDNAKRNNPQAEQVNLLLSRIMSQRTEALPERLSQASPADWLLGTLTASVELGSANAGNNSSMLLDGKLMSLTKSDSKHEWLPISLEQDMSKWEQALLTPLKERLSFQAQQGIKQAHIRLDPPELGKIDILVRTDGDKLVVQLQAAHSVVREQLVQLSERLRLELTGQFEAVNVEVRDQDGTAKEHTSAHGSGKSDEDIMASLDLSSGQQQTVEVDGLDVYV